MPVEADFCLITFTLLPSPFLNATSQAKRNAASWTYAMEGKAGATTFVAPRLARSNAWYNGQGSRALDVTDNIYSGARPRVTTSRHTNCTRTCTCAHTRHMIM